MAKNKKVSIDSNKKLEIAQKIAATSPRVARTYATVENVFSFILRWLSSLLNRIFMSKVFSKIFALGLAIILYFAVNASSNNSLGISQSATITNIPVSVVYNSEIYEISGIPKTVNVIVQGDMGNITLQKSQTSSKVVADLSGLIEGTYTIKLVPDNFNSQLVVNVLDTPNINVTIKKKVTNKFNISYEYINKNQMDSTYNLSEPTFETTEVLIRASQTTIDNIAFVKALIDVTDVNGSFTKDARVVAYDNNGMIVDCDIIPETISVSVVVTSLSKEVPIIVRPIGNLIDGYAIDTIALDYSSVKLYAPTAVLNLIDALYIDVDVSSITKNTVLGAALVMPSGVNSMDVTKVNMEISIGVIVTKTIKDVKVSWINYDTNYLMKVVNNDDALMDVTVSGTQSNVDKVLSSDVTINFDLQGVSIGTQQVPIIATCSNSLVNVEITSGKQYVEVEISAR